MAVMTCRESKAARILARDPALRFRPAQYAERGGMTLATRVPVLCHGFLARLAGNTGKGIISAFVRFLELVFHCEIDVQVGNGRLNYINGYVAKDHAAADVGLGE